MCLLLKVQANAMTEQDNTIYTEYFQIQHKVRVNLLVGGAFNTLPTQEQFEAAIPVPFKMASEMKGLEQTMLRPLRQLGDVIAPLADYLKAQSRKIDLLMTYILQGEDDKDDQYETQSYGGGGFTFVSDESFETEQWFTCKLFFDDEAAAVFCYCKLVESDEFEVEDDEQDTTQHLNKMVFHRIRDDDREIIVRASLHQQSKQLLKKTQAKED